MSCAAYELAPVMQDHTTMAVGTDNLGTRVRLAKTQMLRTMSGMLATCLTVVPSVSIHSARLHTAVIAGP